MKPELPEPTAIRTYGQPYSEGYTADQMRDFYNAALEAAAEDADEYLLATYGASYGVGDFIRKYSK